MFFSSCFSLQSDFQAELDIYKQQLDVKYKLCLACHDIVIQHLKKQAVDLKTFLLGNHLQQSKSTPSKVLTNFSFFFIQNTCTQGSKLGLKSSCNFAARYKNLFHQMPKYVQKYDRSCMRGIKCANFITSK